MDDPGDELSGSPFSGIPFLGDMSKVVTLREGNTPILDSKRAGNYAGLDSIGFKHQGFNPSGSFKDNGMTAGASQARRFSFFTPFSLDVSEH